VQAALHFCLLKLQLLRLLTQSIKLLQSSPQLHLQLLVHRRIPALHLLLLHMQLFLALGRGLVLSLQGCQLLGQTTLRLLVTLLDMLEFLHHCRTFCIKFPAALLELVGLLLPCTACVQLLGEGLHLLPQCSLVGKQLLSLLCKLSMLALEIIIFSYSALQLSVRTRLEATRRSCCQKPPTSPLCEQQRHVQIKKKTNPQHQQLTSTSRVFWSFFSSLWRAACSC
jgi:hypothetical protein